MKTRGLLIFIAALFLIFHPLKTYAQTSITVQGSISANDLWNTDTVFVDGDLVVEDNVTLTINPGTEVRMLGHDMIQVKGTLIAIGTETEPIHFIAHDTVGFYDTSNVDKSWAGIMFNNTHYGEGASNGAMNNNDSSILDHCIIECVNMLNGDYWNGGGITVLSFGKVRVSNCIIRNNLSRQGAGILLDGQNTNAIIDHNTIYNNKTFRHGNFSCWGAGIYISYGSPMISNNLIVNNVSQDYSGGIFSMTASPIIVQNIISNNEGNQGGGVTIMTGQPTFQSNTICNNKSRFGGGIYFDRCPLVELTNNIIYGNTCTNGGKQVYISRSRPDFFNCLIEGGLDDFTGDLTGEDYIGIYTDNLDTTPRFVNSTTTDGVDEDALTADWNLLLESPAINAGTTSRPDLVILPRDIRESPRISYGGLDIGASEYHMDILDVNSNITTDETWAADTVKIHTNISQNNGTVLRIFPGVVVQFQDSYEFDINGLVEAEGSISSPILFTVLDTAGYYDQKSVEGGWGGFKIDYNYNDSRFIHCIFEFAKNRSFVWGGTAFGGAFHISSSKNLMIENCIFRNNFAQSGGALFLSYCFDIQLYNNLFHDNIGRHNNSFYTSIIHLESCGSITGKNNRILNNQAGGYRIRYSHATLINEVICNNESYGLEFTDFTGKVFNGSICNNGTSPVYILNCNPAFYNTIFWGNASSYLSLNGNKPDFYNCNIQSGNTSFSGYQGIYQDCLDLDPLFSNPSGSTGQSTDANTADWSITDLSPCIEAGFKNTGGLISLDLDPAGNPRLNNDIIDAGAYENQAELPKITLQPFNMTRCTGDTATFTMQASGNMTYRWQKDGIDIPGATDPALILPDLILEDEGNYQCFVTNSYGTVSTLPVFLRVKAAPVILIQPRNQYADQNEMQTLEVIANGTLPFTYQWYKDGDSLLEEGNLPEYYISDGDSGKEGYYSCVISNSCGSVQTVPSYVYYVPQLCMVTVSTTSGNNLVIWEKKSKAPVLAYNIYRESSSAGIYDKLATIPFDELSVFADTVADPTTQAFLYKITAIDTAENETDADLCKQHKTVHLLASTNPELNSTQLEWDRYYGFEYQTYLIFRSVDGASFAEVHSLSSNLNSWTDSDPVDGELFYRVAVQRPDPCYPTGGSGKAGAGPYHHALSNLDDNRLQAGQNPPDSIMINNHSINENNAPGALIGKLTTADADTLDSHSYHFVPGEGDDDNSSFTLLGDLLLAAGVFDYETKNTYTIRVRSTDNASKYCENIFTIIINDVSETGGDPVIGSTPPDTLWLDNNSIQENNIPGALVGRLFTEDADTVDAHTYMLIAGVGGDDNSSFTILGNLLLAGERFDYEMKDSYTIRVLSMDLAQNYIVNVFVIYIQDVDETVGIEGYRDHDIKTYPNPFSHTATISFPNPEGKPYRMYLMDITGKVVRSEDNISTSIFYLDRGNLRKGLYLIELRGDKRYRGKLMVE